MVILTVDVILTPAATAVLERNGGEAPPSVRKVSCEECGMQGELRAQVNTNGLIYTGPCEHIVEYLATFSKGDKALLVWGGRPGYSVLTPFEGEAAGWRYGAEEENIYILYDDGDSAAGIILDDSELLAITAPYRCPFGKDYPLPPDLLKFLRDRIRVGKIRSGMKVFTRPTKLRRLV
jgi:hypothetical protein